MTNAEQPHYTDDTIYSLSHEQEQRYDALERARNSVREADDRLVEAVDAARSAGLSWAQVARGIGQDADETRKNHEPAAHPLSETRSQPRPLTTEEQAILELVLEGRTNQWIAEHFYLSKRSLEVRLTRIYGALGVEGKSDLRRLHRLSPPPSD